MRGSPVKLGVIAAAFVVGVIILATAFGNGGAVPAAPSGDTDVVSPSPSPAKSPKPKPSPSSTGVMTGVYNGTSESNLASTVATKLAKEGYVIGQVGNTTDPTTTTTIYYVKADDEAAATYLAENQFSGAQVEAEPAGLKIIDEGGSRSSPNRDLQLLVFIGDDYLK